VSDRQYRAQQSGDVVRLEDALSGTVVSVCPSFGNNAYEMRINGVDVLWRPYESLEAFKASGQTRGGIPFLSPWANRLDEQAFYANGRRFPFDMDIGNVRGTTPIHGLLMRTNRWAVVDMNADDGQSFVTSRLEFYRAPLWMKQFPFAHVIDMTHRLRDGCLDVTTMINNLSAEPMPIAIGFHPYLRLPDGGRDQWTVSIGARTRWLLSDAKLPTGQTEPIERAFSEPRSVPLKDHDLDHVFSDLVGGADGAATMSVQSATHRIEVELGRNYRAAIVFAPKALSAPAGGAAPRGDFVCLEPMAGISNAMNLAHKGVYKDLQYIAPGETWTETFRIRGTGF
jgi:aldose 1-epimerase